ncbi:phage tail tape measure protein [Ferruginibacter yonginensis]|uniref:Phage tail tape measure protein n=1 Tax=Ferruginibacter yonginensis TaxID=1310416 RepID=A0ABV8QS98_9BACT
MSVRTDVVNLQVNVNSNAAQNQLNELRKKSKDIAAEMDGLKRGTQAYIDKKKELATVTAEMDKLKKEIGLTSLNQKELTAELAKLKALKGSTVPFSNEFKDLQKQIKEVENRLYDVKNGVQGFSSFFSKIKDEVKQFGALAAGYLGFQFLSNQFTNIISGSAKLSDQLADLRRVAGLTADEALKLNSSLSKLDTRTAVGSLREIAIIAGKLGVAKNDILGFTEATDKLVVALGDELGNADQITTQLGKILNVFDGKVTGDNITRLGNAFVELANAGVASGGFIAEFDQRLSGIAKTANIGLGELSGLGAGLEELGARTESSSTAIQKLLNNISADIPAAAKIAGKSTEEFRKIFSSDATEALLLYSEGLVKNKTSFEQITASLAGAGEEGARTIETIAKLGSNSDLLREKILLGKNALQDTTAITEAFALKNETFGASLDKLGKQFNSFVSSPGITNFLQGAVKGVSSFISALSRIPKFIDENSTALKLLGLGIVLLNFRYITLAGSIVKATAVKIANAIATRAIAVATNIAIASQSAYFTITNLLIGRITLATAAQRLWNIAINTGLGPLGLLVTVIGAIVFAVNSYSKNVSDAALKTKVLAEVSERAVDSYSDEVAKIGELVTLITSKTTSRETETAALKELIALNPTYLAGLTAENITTSEGVLILKQYTDLLQLRGRLEASRELLKDKTKDDLKLLSKQVELEKELAANPAKDNGPVLFTDTRPFDLEDIKNQRKAVQKEIEIINNISAETTEDLAKKSKAAATATVARLQTNVFNLAAAGKRGTEEFKKALADLRAAEIAFQKEFNSKENSSTTTGNTGRILTPEEIKAAAAEKKRKEKEAAAELERLRKEAEVFQKELKKLRAKAEAGTLSDDDREKANIEEKYRELTEKALKFWKKNTDIGKAAAADIEAIRTAELQALYKKIFERDSGKEYEESLRLSDEFFDARKQQAAQAYVEGKATKEQYDNEIKLLEQSAANNRLQIATDYSNTFKKAEGDITKFKRDQLAKQLADTVAAEEKRKKLSVDSQLAFARLNVLGTKVGSKARLDAEKAYLQEKYRLTIENSNDTAAVQVEKQKELEEQLKELDRQYFQSKVDEVLKYVNAFTEALTALNQFITNRENRELQKDRAANDKKRSNYKQQLDNKLLSQAQYDKEIERLNAEQERKEKEIKLRQAKREKALAIFTAIINTAAGIAKAIPNIALMALAGVTGALQIAAATNAPLPELGRGGHITNGPKHSHSSRGLHLVNPLTGRTEMLLEQNEAVINSNAMDSNRTMTVSGTPKQIASAINSTHGGVSFASGARVTSGWYTQPKPTIRPGVISMMAQGGIIGATAAEGNQYSAANLQALEATQQQVAQLQAVFEQFPKELKARVVLKEIYDADNQYNAAKNASGL